MGSIGGFNLSEEEVDVYSAAYPLMQSSTANTDTDEDMVFQQQMAAALLRAILTRTSIVDALTDVYSVEPVEPIAAKIPAFREYAINNYALGLPNNASYAYGNITNDVLADIIKVENNLITCTVLFSVLTDLTGIVIALPHLIKDRSLDLTTGEVPWSLLEDEWGSVGLDSTDLDWVLYNSDNGLHIEEYTKKCYVSATAISQDRTSISITYSLYLSHEFCSSVPTENYVSQYTESYPIAPEYSLGSPYRVAVYITHDGTIEPTIDPETNEVIPQPYVINWWFYNTQATKYPELTTQPSENGAPDSYPAIPLRYEREFISDTYMPEIYSTGKELLSKIDIPFDSLVDSLSDDPNIGDIDYAYVLFGVNLQTEEPNALKYLIAFFHYLSGISQLSLWDAISGSSLITNCFKFGNSTPTTATTATSSYTDILIDSEVQTSVTTIIEPDEIVTMIEPEVGLDISLYYDWITSVVKEGTISEDTVIDDVIKEVEHNYGEFLPDSHGITIDWFPESILVFKQQLSSDRYREVRIKNLKHGNHVWGFDKYTVNTFPVDLIRDPDNNNLLIPLVHSVVSSLSLLDLNTFYANSLWLVLNWYIITYHPWYTNGYFTFVVTAIAMYVGAYYMGPVIGPFLDAAFSGAEAFVAYIIAAASGFMKGLLIGVVIGFAADMLIDILGPEWTFLVGVIAVVASMGTAKGSITTMLSFSMPTADMFLTVGMEIFDSVNDFITECIEDVAAEFTTAMIDQDAKMAMLEEKDALLHPERFLPVSYFQPTEWLNVTPDSSAPTALYNKKLLLTHVGNIGTLALKGPESFVSRSLLLPEGV